MEQEKRKKKGKGQKKAGKKRKERREDAELTELQERSPIPSPELEQEKMGMQETAFPASGSVEEKESTSVAPREPLKRSDSELSSIIVVGDREESTRVKLTKDVPEADSQPLVSGPSDVADEIVTSPRRKATLSRLDSAAHTIEEETAENVSCLVLAIVSTIEKGKSIDKQWHNVVFAFVNFNPDQYSFVERYPKNYK